MAAHIEEGTNSDIWDDTALIKAYDEAVDAMQDKLLERGIEKSANAIKGREKKKKKKAKNKAKRDQQNSVPNTDNNLGWTQWKVGDNCRAVFTEDGEIYEAVILSVDSSSNSCFIRYLGYGNEEEQYLTDLLPSTASQAGEAGARARGDRVPEAFSEEESASDAVTPKGSRSGVRRGKQQRPHSGYSSAASTPLYPHPSLPFPPTQAVPPPRAFLPPHAFPPQSHGLPPTPPPYLRGSPLPFMPPPNIGSTEFQGAHGFAKMPPPPPIDDLDMIESDKEALHSMLISWYMNGYHTGYYQGLKAGKVSQSKSRRRTEERH